MAGKARDYFRHYGLSIHLDTAIGSEIGLNRILDDFIYDAEDLIETRKATTNEAKARVYREVNEKWKSFVRLYEAEYGKEISLLKYRFGWRIPRDLVQLFVSQEYERKYFSREATNDKTQL